MAHAANRAWLGYTKFQINPFRNARFDGQIIPEGWSVRLHLKNTGNEPALRVAVALYAIPWPPKLLYQFQPVEDEGGTSVVAPDREIETPVLAIGPEDIAVIKGGGFAWHLRCVCYYESASRPGVRNKTVTTLAVSHFIENLPDGRAVDSFSAAHIGLNEMT
jgi:hypothetical protein